MARRTGLPLVIHSRSADEDMADILVNALGAFLRMADMNRFDGDTTLDLVEVVARLQTLLCVKG